MISYQLLLISLFQLCLLSAVKPPSRIQPVLRDTGLLIKWEEPACSETGYIHTYIVQYCNNIMAG